MIGDVARYAFWVHLREVLDPTEPGVVRALSTVASRTQHALSRRQRELMAEELKLSFPRIEWTERTLGTVIRSAYDLQVQCMVEELLLGKLTKETVETYMRFDGREHLDAALARNKGVIMMFPHAGNVMMLIALVSLAGYDFTQVAARGFPPEERQLAADHKPTWFNVKAREARESSEDRLPAQFHGMDANPRQLFRILERNGILAIAFHGRGGSKFRPVRYLGRTALLNTGPWRLAASTGAVVLPAFCIRDKDRTHRLHLCPGLVPDPTLPFQARCEALLEAFLRDAIEPLLEKHPDHYAKWLAHCRVHAPMDDHPLFVDTALDERWRAHEGTRF